MKRMGLLLGTIGMALLLSACGGGSGIACGSSYQSFGISFASSTYTLTKNTNATVTSIVTPESCRNDMTFSVKSGTLPTGLRLIDGNITGTPTVTGTFFITVQIDRVDNYESFSYKPNDSVTLIVR